MTLSPWFKSDVVAETFEPTLEVGDGPGLADLVEIGFPEVAVWHVFGEHMVRGHKDLMGNGESRAQGAAAGRWYLSLR